MSIAPGRLVALSAGLLLLMGGCHANERDVAPPAAAAPPAAVARSKPPAAIAEVRPEPRPPLPEPTDSTPVVVAASLAPERIAAGGRGVLSVRVKVAPTWHIYPMGDIAGANAPTALGLDLPTGLEWSDDWLEPAPSRDPLTHAAIHAGEFEFTRTLSVTAAAAPGNHALAGWISYQVCDPRMCRPPARLDWTATLVVVGASGAPIPEPKTARAAKQKPAGGKIDLKVLYIGAGEGATGRAAAKALRSKEMVEFLESEFVEVRRADRDHFEQGSEGDADVVLLDWSQTEIDLDKLATLASPIGPRDGWKTPIVLLGSAGLLLGVPWQLKGGFG